MKVERCEHTDNERVTPRSVAWAEHAEDDLVGIFFWKVVRRKEASFQRCVILAYC
jgi:hypothetical protein